MRLRTLAAEPLSLDEARALRGSGWEGDLEAMRTPAPAKGDHASSHRADPVRPQAFALTWESVTRPRANQWEKSPTFAFSPVPAPWIERVDRTGWLAREHWIDGL